MELLIGHGTCHIIAETSVQLSIDDVTAAVYRIAGFLNVDYSEVPQDVHLSQIRVVLSAAVTTASLKVCL